MYGVPFASWWSRVGATLIDGLIVTGILLVVGGIFVALIFAVGVSDDELTAVGITLIVVGGLIALALYFLYYPYFVARQGEHNGQSLGKQVVGIRIVRTTGAPMDFGWSCMRELVVKILLFGWIGGSFCSIPTLLDVLWPLWDDENRALHDMLCSTRVVET